MSQLRTEVDQIRDFTAVCSCLKQHESSTSLGGALTGLFGHMFREDKAPSVENLSKSQAIDREGLTSECVGALREIGLGLAESKGNYTIFGGGDRAEAKDLSFVLTDGSKFFKFASNALRSGSHNSELVDGLKRAARNFEARMITDDLSNPSDSTLELFKIQTQLLSILEKVGEYEYKHKLEARFSQAKQGILKETILAEKQQFLGSVTDKNFAAHVWQRDSTIDFFTSRWNGAVEAIKQISNNPKAKDLTQRSTKYLLDAVEFVRADFANEEIKLPFRDNKASFLKVLSDSEREILKIAKHQD